MAGLEPEAASELKREVHALKLDRKVYKHREQLAKGDAVEGEDAVQQQAYTQLRGENLSVTRRQEGICLACQGRGSLGLEVVCGWRAPLRGPHAPRYPRVHGRGHADLSLIPVIP
jgi:hypothetical protein